MNWKRFGTGVLGIGLIFVVIILTSRGAYATDPPEKLCVIIVSGAFGYSSYETGKALAFHDYCIDTGTYSEDDIVFLANPSTPDSDGSANITNIEDAFDWLDENSDPDTEIAIYISDHAEWLYYDPIFRFEDGNITASAMDGWIDQFECDKVTMILNGERSGLAGPNLTGSSCDIICSMSANQANIPDLFNISRSLEDPEADLNQDSIVDYIEAFWKEVERLQGSGQDPVLYSP